MNIKQTAIEKLEKNKIGHRYVHDKQYRIVFSAMVSFTINIIYAAYNALLGHFSNSNWLIILGIYYFVLSVMRFASILFERKAKPEKKIRAMRFSGLMLIELSSILGAMVWIDAKRNMATSHHEIIMITIALYTFIKLTLAIINAVKVKKTNSPTLITMRNISCADAAASILSLQRSMFASFGDSTATDTLVMNICTGIAAFLFVLVLGISMLAVKKNKFTDKKEAQ